MFWFKTPEMTAGEAVFRIALLSPWLAFALMGFWNTYYPLYPPQQFDAPYSLPNSLEEGDALNAKFNLCRDWFDDRKYEKGLDIYFCQRWSQYLIEGEKINEIYDEYNREKERSYKPPFEVVWIQKAYCQLPPSMRKVLERFTKPIGRPGIDIAPEWIGEPDICEAK